jgi:hypothetical protein
MLQLPSWTMPSAKIGKRMWKVNPVAMNNDFYRVVVAPFVVVRHRGRSVSMNSPTLAMTMGPLRAMA